MQHSFDVEIAQEYGILEAIILNHIYYWIAKNKANKKHFYNGKYWTYNSRKAFSELFPYASEKQIRRVLERLVNFNILMTGNFNKQWSDRTLWYTFTDKGLSIMQKSQMQLPEMANDKCPRGQMTNALEGTPIPDINTYINTDNILSCEVSNVEENNDKVKTETYKEIIDYMNTVNEHQSFNVKQIFSYRYNSKDTKSHINARLREGYTINDFKDVIWWGYRKFVEFEFKTQNGESSVKYFRPSTLFSEKHFEDYLNEYRANTK